MPDDPAIGPVPVLVTTAAGGVGSSFTLNYAQFSPGFFPATAPYIVAQHADNSYVTASAPAVPGEVIILWGGGMGPASPSVPAVGQVFLGANPLANTVLVTIGGQAASLDFAGVVGAGLVQINAHVPAGIGSGDQAVVATVGGVSSPSGAYIRVGTPSAATSQLPTPAVHANKVPDQINKNDVVATAPSTVQATPVYAGTDNGIYKSSDGGATWQPSMPSPGTASAIHWIVVDPLHPDRIYAAGVNFSGGDTFFTSLDAGQTWSSASAPQTATLALDASSSVLYLLGLPDGGVYRSFDSGQTWIPTPFAENGLAIVADPNVTGLIYASSSTGADRLLKSYDFGTTWTSVAANLNVGGISALAIDPDDSNTLYAVSAAGCVAGPTVTPCGVFRSTDSGNSWQELGGGGTLEAGATLPFVTYSDHGTPAAVATVFVQSAVIAA